MKRVRYNCAVSILWMATLVSGFEDKLSEFKLDCNFTNAKDDPKLPELSDQFVLQAVANIFSKNYTVEMTEYYDYKNNKAAAISSRNASSHSQLYDYEYGQVFDLFSNGSCVTSNFSDNRFIVFNSTELHHVMKISDFFNEGHKLKIKYIGANVVKRGVYTDQWAACYNDSIKQYRVDYYFAQEGFSMPSGDQYRAPVKVELNGIHHDDKSEFHHQYDYVFYRPGPIDNTAVFEIPHGYVCPDRNTTLTVPALPNVFSSNAQVVIGGLQKILYRRDLFDYDAKLHRTDMAIPKQWVQAKPYGDKYGYNKPLTIIHDYNSGVEYVIDRHQGNCTASNISVALIHDGEETENHLLKMLDAAHIMENLFNVTFTYQGERMFNEVPCHVWSAFREDFPMAGNTTLYERYFLHDDWSHVSSDVNNDAKLAGEQMSVNHDGTWVTYYKSNALLSSYEPISMRHFDMVKQCYMESTATKHLIMKIIGSYDSIVTEDEHLIGIAVRNTIAATAKIEPLRVTDIYFATTNVSEIDVWFTVYDKPKFKGDAVGQMADVTLDQAYNNLKTALKTSLTIKVGEKSLKSKANYLKTDKEVMDPRPSPPAPHVDPKKGLGSGQAAALAIAMLIIGAVIGIGVTVFIFKRRGSEVPYVRDLVT